MKPQWFYPVVKELQPSLLPGVSDSYVTSVASGEKGHMYVNGQILCPERAEDILSRLKQSGRKVSKSIVNERKDGVPVCEECVERWKHHPDSQWAKWERAAREMSHA